MINQHIFSVTMAILSTTRLISSGRLVRLNPFKNRTLAPYSSSNLNRNSFAFDRRLQACIPSFSLRQASTANKSQSGEEKGTPAPFIASASLPALSDDKHLLESSQQHETTINSEILQRLYEISKPERNLILASAGTLAITSSITLLLPYACGHVLDAAMLEAATPGGSGDQFSPFTVALGLFGLTGTAGLGVYARSLMLNIAGNRIVSRIRRRLFASILSQEIAFFDQTKSGDLISRLANDSWFIKSAMTTEAVSGLRGIVMSVGSTSLLFYTSPSLALVSLLSIPPVFLMARIVGRTLKDKQKSVQGLHGNATNIAEEVFSGIKTVQLFNAERLEYDRYATGITAAHDKEVDVGRTKAAFDGVVHVAANGKILKWWCILFISLSSIFISVSIFVPAHRSCLVGDGIWRNISVGWRIVCW